MKKFIGEGLKSIGNNLNVLNVLRTLVEDNDTEVYIPYSYQKETTRSADPKVHFAPKESGNPLRVVAIQSHQERFNFSVTTILNVFVDIENEDGTVDLVPKKVFRNYNIIRDGELTVNHIFAKFGDIGTYNILAESGILRFATCDDVVTVNHKFNPEYVYKISLVDIPLVSPCWANPTQIGLYYYLKRDMEISAILSNVRKLIKEYKEQGQSIVYDSDGSFYTEQYSYSSDKVKVPASCIVYDLPEIKYDIPIEETRKIAKDIDTADNMLSTLSKEQKSIRYLIRCIIFAIENTKNKGNYEWTELQDLPRSKNKKFQTALIENDGEMLKLRRMVYEKDF